MTQEANKKLIEKKQDQSQETAKAINKFKTFLSNLGDDEKTLNKLFASATESKNEEIRCLCFLKLLESPHFKWKPEILELIPQNPGDLRVNTITAIQKSVSSLGDDEETLNKLFKFAKNAKDGYVRGICFVKILNSTHNHVNSIFPLIESLEDPHEKLRALLALAKNTEKISTDILEFVLNNLNLKSFKAEKKHQDFLKNILYYLALNINVSTQMLQRLYNKTVEFKLTREWIYPSPLLAIIKHPKIDDKTLKNIFIIAEKQEKVPRFLASMLQSPKLSKDKYHEIYQINFTENNKSSILTCFDEFAKSPHNSAKQFREILKIADDLICKSDKVQIFKSLASNRNTPEDVLKGIKVRSNNITGKETLGIDDYRQRKETYREQILKALQNNPSFKQSTQQSSSSFSQILEQKPPSKVHQQGLG